MLLNMHDFVPALLESNTFTVACCYLIHTYICMSLQIYTMLCYTPTVARFPDFVHTYTCNLQIRMNFHTVSD